MTFQELLNDERVEERVLIAKKMIQRGMEIEDVKECTSLSEEQIPERSQMPCGNFLHRCRMQRQDYLSKGFLKCNFL